MAFTRLKGLGGALGSFGRSIIQRAQDAGQGIAHVLGLAREAEAIVSPAIVQREWGEVGLATGRQEEFGALSATEQVPHSWFEESEIPWDKPYAYKVAIYGRDLATGRFTRQELDITVSRELTVEEALDETRIRVGISGTSPAFDVFSVSLVGASKRSGEAWR